MFSLDRLEGAKLRAAIIFTCGLCFCLFGYDQGVLGGLIGLPRFLAVLDDPNPEIQGLVVSIYNVGCMIGCVVTACYGLRLGRRKSLMMGCMFVIVGGAVQSATYHVAQISVFRIVTGTGTGIISSTVPVWISEISGPNKRGQKVALELTVVLFGNVMAYWLDYGMSFVPSSASFRFPIAWQCFFPLVALILTLGLPETPRVLYYWNQLEEADRELSRLFAVQGVPESNEITATEKRNILAAIRFEKEETNSGPLWKSLFWDNSPVRNSRRLAIAVIMQALQQLGGCNVITYYQAKLFNESVGLSPNMSRLVAGFSALCFFMGTLPAIYLIEKLGRRKLLLSGSVGCLVAMVAFTALLATSDGSEAMGWAAVAMIFMFEFIFGSTWNCVVWVYAPEISPLRFRHINASVATMSEWAFTFLTVMMAPPALATTGWRIYIFFAVFTFLQIPFVYFFCPETAGRTLEELDKLFADDSVTLGEDMNNDDERSSSKGPDLKEEKLAVA